MKPLTPRRARAVSNVAYIFLLPLVVSCRDMYRQSIDSSSPAFSGGFGTWHDVPIRQPRSPGPGRPYEDVVHSSVWLDLRSEPWWFDVGAVSPTVEFVGTFVDLWGFTLEGCGDLSGMRGPALVSAPAPLRDVPRGLTTIMRGESAFVALVTETSWRDPYALPGHPPARTDLVLRPASTVLGRTGPAPLPPPSPPMEFGFDTTGRSDEFWSFANFALTLVTLNSEDRTVLERIAEIGVAAGSPWSAAAFSDEIAEAIRAGMEDALNDLLEAAGEQRASRSAPSDRDTMDRDYFERALQTVSRSSLVGSHRCAQR